MRERITNLSRRDLLKLFGMSVGATIIDQAARPRKIEAQSSKVTPLKTARHVIVIQNAGAMSPWECLDLKETKWTAKDLDIQKVNSDWNISKTLFPNYQVWAPRASVVHSLRGNALVHFPAQYHTQAGRALNPAILREVPAFGSIVASELDHERRPSDTFPTFMSVDLWNIRCPQIGAGMLHPRFAGLDINTSNVFQSFGGGSEDPEAKSLLAERWEALGRMLEVSPRSSTAPLGAKGEEYSSAYQYAFQLLGDPRFKKVLALSDEEKKRYGVDKDNGTSKLGLGMLLARNILGADAGARFLWIGNAYNGGNGGFDNHVNLYGRGPQAPKGAQMSIYESAPRLDLALANLVGDLEKMPGHAPGKTILDETLIVIAHEFGRTPEMNAAGGRDHFADNYSNLFIGGGVKPGRVIGKTDETGLKCLETGWRFKEQPMMDHVVSTIYSALGIDWTKKIVDTPSGRAYEYQQTAPLGGPAFIPRSPIDELFA